jgi:hypothetical protein
VAYRVRGSRLAIVRQSVLASADFRVLLDESVLHRRIGAPEVMAA